MFVDLFRTPFPQMQGRILDLTIRDDDNEVWKAYGAYFSMKVKTWTWVTPGGDMIPPQYRSPVSSSFRNRIGR